MLIILIRGQLVTPDPREDAQKGQVRNYVHHGVCSGCPSCHGTNFINCGFEQPQAACALGHKTGGAGGDPTFLQRHAVSQEQRQLPHFLYTAFAYQHLQKTACRYMQDSSYLHFGQDFDVVGAEELLGAQGNLLRVGIHRLQKKPFFCQLLWVVQASGEMPVTSTSPWQSEVSPYGMG